MVAAAEQAALDAQAAADEAAEDTDETALQAALELMANKPVDDDVMEWAKEVLGFGEEVGKIDEMREVLEAAAADGAAETPDIETPETVDLVVPVDPAP